MRAPHDDLRERLTTNTANVARVELALIRNAQQLAYQREQARCAVKEMLRESFEKYTRFVRHSVEEAANIKPLR